MLVAVKTPRENIHKDRIVLSSIIQEVLDEIRVMSFLSLHPNVVTLIGVALERSSDIILPRLVVERAVGSLGDILRASSSSSRSGGVPLSLKLRFLLEIAAGLEALHLLDVVHGDVKADNILVIYSCSNWGLAAVAPMLVAKVSDFGFCVPDTSARDAYVASRGTFRFKAPEALPEAPPLLHRHINLPHRDVYSYGVTLSEIMNDGLLPFRDVEDKDVVHLQLSSEDGAANQLITSGVFGAQGSLHANQHVRGALVTVIKGTVGRDPLKRILWQEVFNIVCAFCEGMPSPARHSTFKEYFTTHSLRQRQTCWNIFQSYGSYLPTIPSRCRPTTMHLLPSFSKNFKKPVIDLTTGYQLLDLLFTFTCTGM
ncbi:kinase-like protein [Hymenopellis radicata]|nr:kinase-like protein [Hymenopellis radicata]